MKAQTPSLIAAGAALALTLIVGAVSTQPSRAATAGGSLADEDIRWDVRSNIVRKNGGASAPTLRLSQKHSTTDLSLDGQRPEFGEVRMMLAGAAGPAGFRVMHDAGRLDCTGALTAAFTGTGRCRFTPDPGFARSLAMRGIGTPTPRDQLALLMVDARLALADGLIREGLRPKDSNDLIAAAAMAVTPAYVRELKSGALRLTSIQDAIACRALGVDGAYVRGLAAAGYTRLSSDEVVSMKALGVTPDYARSMNAAAGHSK